MKINSMTAVTLTGSSQTVRQICVTNGISLAVMGFFCVVISAANDSTGHSSTAFNVAIGADASGSSPYFRAATFEDVDAGHIYGPGQVVVVQVYSNNSGGPLPNWV